ncbi:hypothetical protein N7U49_42180 [Streptomyces sp. AD2-2]|nr:hypothetical protein N7U49_42180 [Streptomyces sp. AD2-2]
MCVAESGYPPLSGKKHTPHHQGGTDDQRHGDRRRDGDGGQGHLFRRAQADSRKGAELGKRLLSARLGGS